MDVLLRWTKSENALYYIVFISGVGGIEEYDTVTTNEFHYRAVPKGSVSTVTWTVKAMCSDSYGSSYSEPRSFNYVISIGEVTDNGADQLLVVSPNPARNTTQILLPSQLSTEWNMTMYNSLGDVIQSWKSENSTQDRHVVEASLSNLASGVYHLVLRCGSRVYYHDCVVLHE